MKWQAQASCQGLPTSMFYDIEKGSVVNPAIPRMCMTCPVNAECLEYAVKHEAWGYWAGTTPTHRRRIRKEANIILSEPQYG